MSSPRAPTAGIGSSGALLGLAKLVFLLAAYATSIALTRLFDPGTFGRYSVVAALIAVPNMILIQALLFAVSRPLSAQLADAFPAYRALRRRGLLVALVLGGSVSAVFAAAAPLFALGLSDPDLAGPVRAVAPISLLYALYAVNLGTLNATRRFAHQAGLDMFMATTKAGLIVGLAVAGFGLTVTMIGFTAASLLAAVLSLLFVRLTRPPGTEAGAAPAPALGRAVGIMLLFTAATNLLQSIDLLLLKHFAADTAARDHVGFYASAQLVARVPLSLMNAVSLVMFPLIASLRDDGDGARVRTYVGNTAKLTLLLLSAMSSVVASAAVGVQALLFPAAYGSAADELRALVWGFSGYSLLITAAWILQSREHGRLALLCAFTTLALVAGAGLIGIPDAGTGGAARAVLVGGLTGGAIGTWALHRAFAATIPWAFAIKVGLAVVGVELLARALPWATAGRPTVVLGLAALVAAFAAIVVATGAIRPRDLLELRRVRS